MRGVVELLLQLETTPSLYIIVGDGGSNDAMI